MSAERRGIGDAAAEAILAGCSNAEALAAVLREFPNAKTTLDSIKWYRRVLRMSDAKRLDHVSKVRRRKRLWDAANLEKSREDARRWNAENRDRKRKNDRAWRVTNLERNRELGRRCQARRRASPHGKIVTVIRRTTSRIVRQYGGVKTARSIELLGCSLVKARLHIERQFLPRMSWSNYGTEWHIDHVRPLASFDLLDPEQVRAAAHYTNLQPLWAADNLSKSARWLGG